MSVSGASSPHPPLKYPDPQTTFAQQLHRESQTAVPQRRFAQQKHVAGSAAARLKAVQQEPPLESALISAESIFCSAKFYRGTVKNRKHLICPQNVALPPKRCAAHRLGTGQIFPGLDPVNLISSTRSRFLSTRLSSRSGQNWQTFDLSLGAVAARQSCCSSQGFDFWSAKFYRGSGQEGQESTNIRPVPKRCVALSTFRPVPKSVRIRPFDLSPKSVRKSVALFPKALRGTIS